MNVPVDCMYRSDAPWNDNSRKVKVTVVVTQVLTKEVEIEVDEAAEHTMNSREYSEYLIDCAREQVNLPGEKIEDWDEDELIVE